MVFLSRMNGTTGYRRRVVASAPRKKSNWPPSAIEARIVMLKAVACRQLLNP